MYVKFYHNKDLTICLIKKIKDMEGSLSIYIVIYMIIKQCNIILVSILHNKLFHNQGSEKNKNDIFLRFHILSFKKTFFLLLYSYINIKLYIYIYLHLYNIYIYIYIYIYICIYTELMNILALLLIPNLFLRLRFFSFFSLNQIPFFNSQTSTGGVL